MTENPQPTPTPVSPVLARALDRFPTGLGITPDDPEGASNTAVIVRRPYRLAVAFTHVQNDSMTRRFMLTDDEADAWAADVAELLTVHREGTVWFTDDDGDRVSCAVDKIAFTNLAVSEPGEPGDESEDHPVARDLSQMFQGMNAFLEGDDGDARGKG